MSGVKCSLRSTLLLAERFPEALRRIAKAHARLARVKLLFGIDIDAGKFAESAINTLWNGRHALERDPPDTTTALEASGQALRQLNEFTVSARAALEKPRLRRSGTWPPATPNTTDD